MQLCKKQKKFFFFFCYLQLSCWQLLGDYLPTATELSAKGSETVVDNNMGKSPSGTRQYHIAPLSNRQEFIFYLKLHKAQVLILFQLCVCGKTEGGTPRLYIHVDCYTYQVSKTSMPVAVSHDEHKAGNSVCTWISSGLYSPVLKDHVPTNI